MIRAFSDTIKPSPYQYPCPPGTTLGRNRRPAPPGLNRNRKSPYRYPLPPGAYPTPQTGRYPQPVVRASEDPRVVQGTWCPGVGWM